MILTARILLLALATSTAPALAASGAADDVRAGVTKLIQRWSDAGEASDWATVAGTYADDPGFAWIEQGEARYTSKAAILAGLDQARAMKARIRNDVSNVIVTPLADNVAAYRADYEIEVVADGFGFASSGVLSGVAVRHSGRWQLLQGSFSARPDR